MRQYAVAVVFGLAAVGCVGDAHSWMPLEEGNIWHMKVSSGLLTGFVEVKVNREAQVGPYSGWELVSRMGASRLAWSEGTLYASELSGTRYSPPIPLLAELGENQSVRWKGTVTTGSIQVNGAATLVVKQTKEKVGVRSHPAREATVTLAIGDSRHEIQTSFVRGVGIVRQEHRVDGALENRISYSSGP